jgi:hypothetical protein
MGAAINFMIAGSESMANMSTANKLLGEMSKLKEAISVVENEFRFFQN